MADVLVVAEVAEGKLKKTTHSAITFAQKAAATIGGTFSILVIGDGAGKAAAEAQGFGAAKILVVEDASLKNYLAERYAPTVAAIGKNYGVVVGTASAYGKDLLPRVAARLGAGYASDITEVIADGGALKYKRPMFAGNAFGIASISTPIQVVSVRQSAFAAAEPTGGQSPVETVAYAGPSKAAERVEFVSFDQVKSARPELTEARVVVSGGRALKEKFNQVLDPLADALGAAVGASRAACDAGYAPSDLQVGQTGKIVAPQLYFAIGISGAIQHLAGMKGSKVIVAINKDADAPIFQVADYGLVADLFTTVPELVKGIQAAKG
ncbi:electron transfer flavoprotein subunit alpha/FixB family protein [Polyangium jinanense]|uniref:Electron transfer flavoprotein subunit alpha n=1 Tax=Polyangium jinanense TaxID=2829994 RepID=A0A9X3WW83_9BACT|nr:electron transfer flavoprotein subunit alpha/FixB family protein [Polyangium jinanense]MDC3953445.1 electron transfer flavoprotein subunit alpha/FixB family protein [Polyangium jinanense]MDC3979434.1 electron transfer flavoprotein subunit alpha/FixB family protein [Polyangium jinanense]